MDIIRITKSSFCYPEIDSFIIIIAALSSVLEYKSTGKAHYNPGDYTTCDGLAVKKSIRLPLYGPIEAIIADKKVASIELTITNIAPPTKYVFKTSALIETAKYLITPFFISFYERCYSIAESKFKKDYSIWPSAWKMGWVVRNA